MSSEEMDELAAKIVAGLNGNVLPAVLPKGIGDQIRALGRQTVWVHMLPLQGGEGISVHYVLTPEGGVNMEFRDSYGSQFWRGSLTSER